MARLHNKMGLRDNLLEKLNENKIFTILDFLSESSEKMSAAINASFKVSPYTLFYKQLVNNVTTPNSF